MRTRQEALATVAVVFAIVFAGMVFGIAGSGCHASREGVIEAIQDVEQAVIQLHAAEDLAKADPNAAPIARHLVEALGDFENAAAALGIKYHPGQRRDPFRPATHLEAVAISELLGLGKSCGDRCWNCAPEGCGNAHDGHVCAVCPFFACMGNCSAGRHPVCCDRCDNPGSGCPGLEGDPAARCES